MKIFLLTCMLLTLAAWTALGEGGTLPKERYACKVVNCDEWVSLRVSPDTSSERAMEVPLGAVVEYCEDLGRFTYCHYENRVGYILTEYLSKDTDAAQRASGGADAPTSTSGAIRLVPLTAKGTEVIDGVLNYSAADMLTDEALLNWMSSGMAQPNMDLNAYQPQQYYDFELTGAEPSADVTAGFPYVPALTAEDRPMGLVGLIGGDGVEWIAVKCAAGANGEASVVFPAALVGRLQDAAVETVLMVYKG